ncbi:hypothetical protein AC578_1416 [Pseudocercospora eumusae]|uniref:Uncharacterized protein n=1 Tax=Pseudocercospora eumusae TaxID=321146 RepID=A0A139HUY4_9PEZI|nr:hypothetical protein AC578_1416 [Pseudocercospora eumusae]
MADGAAPAPLTDEDLKALLPLLATEKKYNAGYTKQRLPPNHIDSAFPAIHCLEHEVDHASTCMRYPPRHWFRSEHPRPRTRKRRFHRSSQGRFYNFQVFDSGSSNACVFEDPERDIELKMEGKERDTELKLKGKTKKTCIFIEEGDQSVVRQPFLLRNSCSVSLKSICNSEHRDIMHAYVRQVREALQPGKLQPGLKMAYGWHGQFLEFRKWEWRHVKQNWKRGKLRTHRTNKER